MNTISFAFGFKIGSAFEERPGELLSLFTHLQRNSERFNERELAKVLDSLGIQLFSHVGRTSCFLGMTVPPKNFENAFDIFNQMLLHPSFEDKIVTNISQQLNGNLKQLLSIPDELLTNTTRWLAAFGKSKISQAPIGTEQTFQSINTQRIEQMYTLLMNQKPYFACIGHEVNPLQLEQIGFNSLVYNLGTHELSGNLVEDDLKPLNYETKTFPDAYNSYFNINIRTQGISNSPYQEEIFMSILGGGLSARLFTEIREKRNLSYGPYAYVSNYQNFGLATIGMDVHPNRLEEAINTTVDLIDEILSKEVPRDEIKRAVKTAQSTAVFVSDTSSAYTNYIISNLLLGRNWDLEHEKAQLEAAIDENWQEYGRKLWQPKNLSFALTGQVLNGPELWLSKMEGDA